MTVENEKEKKSGLISLLIITIVIYRGMGLVLVGCATELFKGENESTQIMIYSICLAVTMAIAVPLLLRKRDMLYLSTEIGFLKMVIVIAIGTMGSIAISGFFTGAATVFGVSGMFATETAVNTPGAGSHMLLQVFGEGIAPAISEELVFRGVIFAIVRTRYNFGISAFIVSFIFGFSHGVSLLMLITFAGGFFLCYVYERTNNICIPILIHGSYNMIGVLARYYADKTSDGTLQLDGTESLIMMMISMVVVVSVVFVVQIITKGKTKTEA